MNGILWGSGCFGKHDCRYIPNVYTPPNAPESCQCSMGYAQWCSHSVCVCVSMYLMDCSRKASHHSEDSLYAFSSPPLIPLTCWTKAQSWTCPGSFGGCSGMLSSHSRQLLCGLFVLRGREGCNRGQRRKVRRVWKTNKLNPYKGFLNTHHRSRRWVGSDPERSPCSLPGARTPSTRPACSETHPAWPGWDIHNFSGQPILVPHHSHSKELPSWCATYIDPFSV